MAKLKTKEEIRDNVAQELWKKPFDECLKVTNKKSLLKIIDKAMDDYARHYHEETLKLKIEGATMIANMSEVGKKSPNSSTTANH